MPTAMDLLRDILDTEREKTNEALPAFAGSEDPAITAYRLGLGVRKPSQKMLLSQIFGEPDSPEETAMQQLFRIRRERV